jgi:RNA polymerase subunit RPABC4/transcription elongation factor Spt4
MKKVCKNDRLIYEGASCPLCHGSDYGTTWQGRISVIDPSKSFIARKTGSSAEGDFAIKIR